MMAPKHWVSASSSMAVAGDTFRNTARAAWSFRRNYKLAGYAERRVNESSGEPHKFLGRIRSLEKYSLVVGAGKESMKRFALSSSEGPVSDFLPQCTWQLK